MSDFRNKRRFLKHPDAGKWDAITIETVERWKESELSGDEWRFSHPVSFWFHGEVIARRGTGSVREAAGLVAGWVNRLEMTPEEIARYREIETEVCCQPGCGNGWTVLLHPLRKYTKSGDRLADDYWPGEVRAFCERHRYRGDCALDDADDNYELVEERPPPEWMSSAEADR